MACMLHSKKANELGHGSSLFVFKSLVLGAFDEDFMFTGWRIDRK